MRGERVLAVGASASRGKSRVPRPLVDDGRRDAPARHGCTRLLAHRAGGDSVDSCNPTAARTASGRSSTSISGSCRNGAGAFDGVFQFSNVAGPGVVEQALQCARRVPDHRPAEAHSRLRQDLVRQAKEFFEPLPERRHVQVDHAEPVVQIAAKPTLCDLLEQVSIGRGHETHVDASGSGFAEANHLAFLNHAQQLDLHRG